MRTDLKNRPCCMCPRAVFFHSSDLGLEAGLGLGQVSIIQVVQRQSCRGMDSGFGVGGLGFSPGFIIDTCDLG